MFDGNRRLIGEMLSIAIHDASGQTLFGSVVTEHVGPEVFELQV